MQHISFPSIDQFRHIVQHISSGCKYHNVPLPVIRFTGTVKLHGTNAGVCRPVNGDQTQIWAQSRENIITPEKDNAGFAAWATVYAAELNRAFDLIRDMNCVPSDATDPIIQIFGEWCGGNIQKGVGITGLPKTFVIFGVRVSDDAASENWIDIGLGEVAKAIALPNVFAITQFSTWDVLIDFSNPEAIQNTLVELTNQVEKNCPVAASLWDGLEKPHTNTVGEGIVWEAWSPLGSHKNRLRFKVKGEKHSVTKTKQLATVDVEKVANVAEFVANTVTNNRLTQGLDKLRERQLDLDPKNTGEFIKWVVGDILKEELDTLVESGLTTKDVTSQIATVARNFFLNNLEL